MLSKTTVSCINLCVKLSVYFKATPYSWNECTLISNVNPDWKAKCSFLITTLYVNLHFLFQLFRCIQSVLFLGVSPPMFLIQLAFVVQASISPICQNNTLFRSYEFSDFLNKFLQNDKELSSMDFNLYIKTKRKY